MHLLSPIFCKHLIIHQVTDIDTGEIMCGDCGYVMDRIQQENSTLSTTNLYNDLQLGSMYNPNLVDKSTSRYIHFENTELSVISNICNSMRIPKSIEHDIFSWYKKIRRNIPLTKAKIVILVFYKVCECNDIPLNEKKLTAAVKSIMHVKNAPDFKNIIYTANSFLDKNNIPILDKIGFNALTRDDSAFYIRSKINELYEKYDYDTVEKLTKIIYSLVQKNPKDLNKAIKIAKRRCGIC